MFFEFKNLNFFIHYSYFKRFDNFVFVMRFAFFALVIFYRFFWFSSLTYYFYFWYFCFLQGWFRFIFFWNFEALCLRVLIFFLKVIRRHKAGISFIWRGNLVFFFFWHSGFFLFFTFFDHLRVLFLRAQSSRYFYDMFLARRHEKLDVFVIWVAVASDMLAFQPFLWFWMVRYIYRTVFFLV